MSRNIIIPQLKLSYDTVPAECHNTDSKYAIFKVRCTNILEVHKSYITYVWCYLTKKNQQQTPSCRQKVLWTWKLILKGENWSQRLPQKSIEKIWLFFIEKHNTKYPFFYDPITKSLCALYLSWKSPTSFESPPPLNQRVLSIWMEKTNILPQHHYIKKWPWSTFLVQHFPNL